MIQAHGREDERVVIHQLSDIELENVRDLRERPHNFPFSKYIAYLGSSPANVPDVIIVGGDLVREGWVEGYGKLDEQFFARLIELLDDAHPSSTIKAKDRILIIPGNHDMERGGSGLERFYDAHKEFANPRQNGGLVTFKELGLAFWLIDSNAIQTQTNVREEAEVYRDIYAFFEREHKTNAEAQKLVKRLEKFDKNKLGSIVDADIARTVEVPKEFFKICVIHHPITNVHVVATDTLEAIDVPAVGSARLKLRLQKLEFDLVLHGHIHRSHLSYEIPEWSPVRPEKGFHVLASPAFGSKETWGDAFNGFNRIEIRRREGENIKRVRIELVPFARQEFGEPRLLGKYYPPDPTMWDVERARRDIIDAEPKSTDRRLQQLTEHLELWLATKKTKAIGYGSGWFAEYRDKVLPRSDAAYAVDVQGPITWADPEVHSYFALQLHRLSKVQGTMERGVKAAIMRARQTAKKNFNAKWRGVHEFAPKPGKRRLSAFRDPKTPMLPMCRILLWNIDEVRGRSVRCLIDTHENCHIPLFLIDTSSGPVRRTGEQDSEYVLFQVNKGPDEGLWLASGSQEDAWVGRRKAGVPSYAELMTDFKSLLAHPDILLARDAMVYCAETVPQRG